MLRHKEKILKLRSEGLSYDQIKERLGCSKGTISFHCAEGQKEKAKQRKLKSRTKDEFKFLLCRKISAFNLTCKKISIIKDIKIKNSHDKNLYNKYYKFVNRHRNINMAVSVEEILSKIKETTKCALTGRELNIKDTSSWHLDHIIPSARGGDNSLENCQIVCKEVNLAKRDLMDEEFIQLCKDVLIHQGYKIIKD